jgi:hypothetical protein
LVGAETVKQIEAVGVTKSVLDEGEVLRDFVKRRVGPLRVGGARFVVVAAALIDHRFMVCHWPGALESRVSAI